MRRLLPALLILATVIGLVPAAAAASADEPWDGLRAGVGVADATWHVGAAAGQYTDYRNPADEVSGGDIDPSFHATSKENSYGVASRLTIRAIVVEGSNGQRVALVKSDNYLAQDHLLRRVGQLLDEAGSRVTYDNILHAATHNHSSPYYATPSWGVWVFEDVVDLRMFEYQARAMADAILQAEADLAPARMGATTVKHSLFKGNIMRPQTADDGSPAGFPNDYGDKDLTLLRFDRRTDAGYEPMAVWMNWGQHPESLDSYDLITADYLGPLERFVERDTGATLVFSQGDVGSAEGPYEGWNRGRMDDGTLVAWAHVGHAQMERGARLLADAVVEGFEEIGRGEGTVPYATDVPVEAINGWVPGPASHPYPSVSNCRTETTLDGDPGIPVAGLPDCQRTTDADQLSPLYDNLQAHGIPVPDQYDAPAFTAVEENVRLRLQVLRLGDVLIGSCACEAQVDLIRNFKSRANDVVGDIHDGFDWADDEHTTCDAAGGRRLALRLRRPRRPRPSRVDVRRRRLPALAGPGPQPGRRVGRARLPALGQRRADRPGGRQGQLHRRGARRGHRLPAGRRRRPRRGLQRLHRQLPRVPGLRPLPQGPDQLRPAHRRLHGHVDGADGPLADRPRLLVGGPAARRRPDDPGAGRGRRGPPARDQPGARARGRSGLRRLAGGPARRRRPGRRAHRARGHHPLRRGVRDVAGRLQRRRQPGRHGRAPGRRCLAALRRHERRGPDHGRPAQRRQRRARHLQRRAGVDLDRRVRGVHRRPQPRAGHHARPAPTGSSSTATSAPAGRPSPTR